jgi:hypothetical protein
VKSLPQIEAARFSKKVVFSYKNTHCCGEQDRGLNFIVYITTDTLGFKKENLPAFTACILTFHNTFSHSVLCKVGKIKSNQLVSLPSLFTLYRLSLLPPHDVNIHAPVVRWLSCSLLLRVIA